MLSLGWVRMKRAIELRTLRALPICAAKKARLWKRQLPSPGCRAMRALRSTKCASVEPAS